MAENKVENITAQSIMDEARQELRKDAIKDATRKMKTKLRELSDAKRIVRNLEREVEDLQLEITHDLDV